VLADDARAPMTLAQAVEWAREHSGLVAAARAGTGVFEAKLQAAEWTAWPHVEARGILAPMPAERGNALAGKTDYSDWGVFLQGELTAYVPLYTFGKISHLKAASRLGVDVGRAQEAIARAEVTYRVKKAFYGLSLSRELAGIVSEGRGYLDKARKKLDEKASEDDPSFDPVDRMKLRVIDAQILAKELEANRTRDLATGNLRYTMGASPADETLVFEVPAPEPVKLAEGATLDSLEASAKENRPELVALRRGVRARSEECAARTATFFPDLFLAGMGKIGYSNVADNQASPFAYDPYNTMTAGGAIGLKFDLDIGKKLGELAEARANRAKLEADLREAENGVRLEVEKLHREVTDGRRVVDAMADAEKAARGWVIAKSDLYDNDMAEVGDVTAALMQFFQARLDRLKAIYDYNVAVAALERATGMTVAAEPGP
jgi:outer membrane protein TolC